MGAEAAKGAEYKAEGFGEKAPFEIPELAPCHSQGRRPIRSPLYCLRKDQNGNILDKLAGSQDFIGKEIKAINEKGALLRKGNAGVAPRAPSTASRTRSSRSPRP